MQLPIGILTSAAIVVFAGTAGATETSKTIAVFTKNSTNPAYEAFRIAADKVAAATGTRVVHFVPKQPDNVDEQKAMVDQILKAPPDVVIFIPVDDVAMVNSVKKLNDAGIPIVLVCQSAARPFRYLCRRRRFRDRLP